MAIVPVKHTVVQNASGSPQVFTGITSTAGNTLVAVITVKAGSTSDVSAVTDSSGANTWVAGPNAFISGVNSRVAIWYVTNAAAIGTSVTVTLTLAKAASIDVREYSGVVTASPVDSSGTKTNNVTGTTQLSGPVTTANANDVLVAGITQATASIACSSVSAGFNLSANAQATSTLCAVYSADQIVAATGTYECTFTMASSGAASGGTILALKAAAGGAGAVLAGTIAGIASTIASVFTPLNAVSTAAAVATAQAFSPLNASSAAAATVTATTFSQIASPTTDLSVMSWTDQTGSNANLAAAIDEAGPNDADYIQSSYSAGIGDETKIRLAPMTDPVSSSGHTLRYRYGKDAAAGDTVDLIVTLYDSDAVTVIHTVTHSNVSNTLTDGSFILSGGETDAITGYAAGLVLGLKRG